MTNRRLLLQSLVHHWRSTIAVLLCVAVATSVLSGALLVGDSMRGSLLALTLNRLGRVDFSLASDRMFGEELALRLDRAAKECWGAAAGGSDASNPTAAPVLLLRGSAARADESGQAADRAGQVQVCGVPRSFWSLNRSGATPAWSASWDDSEVADGVVINEQLANEVKASAGDTLLIRVERPSEIPREAVLGRKDDLLSTLRVTVTRVIAANEFGDFKLTAGQRAPRNVFMPLDRLADAVGHTGRANSILIASPPGHPVRQAAPDSDTIQSVLSCLQRALTGAITLPDYGLRVASHPAGESVSLESRRMVLEPAAIDAVRELSPTLDAAPLPIMAYLANAIRTTGRAGEQKTIPYSTIAALPFDHPAVASNFELKAGSNVSDLADDEILVNTWTADDLQVKPGDEVTIEYYVAEPRQPFETAEATFRVRGVVEINGMAADPTLVPEYPGITNAERYSDWDPPFPMDLKRIRPRDEDYWDEYRATPKAFISLEAGERLWSSRFGKWTSLRFTAAAPIAPGGGASGTKAASQLADTLLERLQPDQFGLVFRAVGAEGIAASAGGTDFGGLFIGFSFFLIVAAAILIGLVFRLGVERRAKQVGLLLALGHSRRSVRLLLVLEGLIIALVGTAIGLAGAIGYAWLVIAGLRTWWFAAVGTSLLTLHVSVTTLVVGTASSLLLTGLTVMLALRGLARSSPRALLAGQTVELIGAVGRHSRRLIGISVGVLAVAGLVVGFWMRGSPVAFFVWGVVLLLVLLVWMTGRVTAGGDRQVGGGGAAIARLGMRNASRNRTRSVLTIGLVALATFVIVAVGANRRDEHATDQAGGDRWLVAESSVPLLYDLNTSDGRRDLGLADDVSNRLASVRFFRFRAKAGEDASCLNLYRPGQPRLLGASKSTFQATAGVLGTSAGGPLQSAAGHGDLETDLGPDVFPALGDANSVKWILHMGIGDRLPITAEDGRTVQLEIVGLLERSVFQSELIISEANFQRLFPSEVGYSVFLMEGDGSVERSGGETGAGPGLSTLLEEQLSDYGFDATSVAARIAEYHAVENTYLATFQMLGGLGLMLGTLGLGAVVLRGVFERRGELALLLAVGYRPAALAWLVLAETAYLLVAGLIVGTISALVAVLPHVAAHAREVPWGSLAGTLLLVLGAGLAASAAAVLATLRTPLLPALRSE